MYVCAPELELTISTVTKLGFGIKTWPSMFDVLLDERVYDVMAIPARLFSPKVHKVYQSRIPYKGSI